MLFCIYLHSWPNINILHTMVDGERFSVFRVDRRVQVWPPMIYHTMHYNTQHKPSIFGTNDYSRKCLHCLKNKCTCASVQHPCDSKLWKLGGGGGGFAVLSFLEQSHSANLQLPRRSCSVWKYLSTQNQPYFHICPNWTPGPPSLLYNGYLISFQGGGEGGLSSRGLHWPPTPVLKLKNGWKYTSTHPLCLHGMLLLYTASSSSSVNIIPDLI
jgi:hypothetical protein